MTRLLTLFALLFPLLAASRAEGQGLEASFGAGMADPTGATAEDRWRGPYITARVGYGLGPVLQMRLDVSSARLNGRARPVQYGEAFGDVAVTGALATLVGRMPTGRLRPYVSLGLGAYWLDNLERTPVMRSGGAAFGTAWALGVLYGDGRLGGFLEWRNDTAYTDFASNDYGSTRYDALLLGMNLRLKR